MGQEIERKFIVNEHFPVFPEIKWDNSIHYWQRNIKQGYFKDGVTRIRITSCGIYEEGEEAYLTIKSENTGISREEFEYKIPVEDAYSMMGLFCETFIEKSRHRFKEEGKIWEVDVFQKDNAGLILAEVELEFEDEDITLPGWVGKEVTGDKRYYNKNLVKNPYTKWRRLYTSYFNSGEWDSKNAISIAGKSPPWYNGREYKKLAPKYDTFKKYKENGDEALYRYNYFIEVLDRLDPEEVYNDLGKDAVLLCWEKPGEFCHRHIVAEWLTNALDIEVKESGEE